MANDGENSLARLSKKSYNWDFGKLSRLQSEQLLIKKCIGTFLIRESEHYPGDYTLSIKDDKEVQHYRIKFDSVNQTYTIDDDIFFSSLSSLVEHYELDADGLCCRLEYVLSSKPDNIDSSRTVPFVTQFLSNFPSMIDYKELQIGKTIGSGEFAEVYEALYRKSRVAVKVLKESSSTEHFLREADIMNSLNHRNLVQLLGIAQTPDNDIYLVTEFMEKGSLLHYLTTRGRSVISQKDLLGFAVDICEGLNYLEQNHIVHRDIAASNVLLTDNDTAKISDFGLAKKLEPVTKENGNYIVREKIKCRTKWTAPEALELRIYTHKSDVWSYGILLWEIFSYGRCPYPRIPADEVLMNLQEGYRMDPPDDCPTEIGDIMHQTWHPDPHRRPSFYQILERLEQLDLSF